MAAVWKPKLLEGNRGTYERDERGVARLTVYESGLVTGLDGGGSEILAEAIDTTGVPKLDSEHPTLSALTLASIQPEVRGQNEVRLTLVYRERVKEDDEPIGIEYGMSLTQTQVNTYYKLVGDVLVEALMAVDFKIDGVSQGIQYAFASVLLPEKSRNFTWRTDVDPGDDIDMYTGKACPYDLFAEGDAAKWLCAMSARSSDSGQTFDVQCNFLFRDKTWLADVVWIDPTTNRPPDGVEMDNGRELYIVYRSADHRELALPGMLSE